MVLPDTFHEALQYDTEFRDEFRDESSCENIVKERASMLVGEVVVGVVAVAASFFDFDRAMMELTCALLAISESILSIFSSFSILSIFSSFS